MANPIKILAKIEKIITFAKGIYVIRLQVPKRVTRFKAGQFLHLTLEEFDPSEGYWPESRVFSIASKPGGDFIEIVYSVKGVYTKKMEAVLKEGMQVWLKLPYGDYIVDQHITEGQHVVFIAGGTGISPFVPYLYQRQEQGPRHPLSIFYGIRDQEHYLYKALLEEMAPIADVRVTEGTFDIEGISREVSRIENAVCFVSGPPDMIQAFQQQLGEYGFPPESIIIDAWE